MQPVVPAVIPTTYADLKNTLESVSAFSGEVQIDIVDGQFVPFLSWPYHDGDEVADICIFSHNLLLEFDLMIMRPEERIDEYIDVGAKRIVIHRESTENIEAIFRHPRRSEYALGLSILNSTPLEELTQHINEIDYVQLMGIGDIGSQGQPFDERVLLRIEKLRSDFPDLLISIDGSVNAETLPRLREAGADRFISGSAILKASDPELAFKGLERLAL